MTSANYHNKAHCQIALRAMSAVLQAMSAVLQAMSAVLQAMSAVLQAMSAVLQAMSAVLQARRGKTLSSMLCINENYQSERYLFCRPFIVLAILLYL